MNTILALLLSASAAPVDIRPCLQDYVVLSEVDLVKEDDRQWYFEFTAQNNFQWPVSGVELRYEIVTPGRTVAWDKGVAVVSIPGGIEPGEFRELKVRNMRGYELTKTPFDYKLKLTINDVMDPEGRPLIQEVVDVLNPVKRSELTCD